MENLPAENKPNPIITMDESKGMVPRNFDGLWRMSCIFADSGLMPKGLQRKESVFVAIQMGLEIGLSPMQAIQNIAVINGRPSVWGDSVLALVRSSGLLEFFKEELLGDLAGGSCLARCTAKRKGDDEPTIREFTQADAKMAGLFGKDIWRAYPKRMLQMRARSWALRDAFSDVLKGVRVAEEQMDATDAVTLQQNDLGGYEADIPEAGASTQNADMSIYGVPEPAKTKQVKVADDGGSEPAGANRYNGSNSQPPEGHTDGESHTGPGQANEATPIDWDPREAPLMSRYVPKKEAVLKAVAGDMGIDFAGLKTNREIHWNILYTQAKKFSVPVDNRNPDEIAREAIFLQVYFKGVVQSDREDPEVGTGDADSHLSPRDRFVHALNDHGADGFDIGNIGAYVHEVAMKTDRTVAEVYESASKSMVTFLSYFNTWLNSRNDQAQGVEPDAGEDSQQEDIQDTSDDEGQETEDLEIRNNLRDQLVLLRHKEEDRYKNVTNALVNSGQLPGTSLSEWSTDQMHDVIDAINDKF